MPRVSTHESIERSVRDKFAREKSFEKCAWNLLVREVKLIARRQNVILERLEAYGKKLYNLQQEVHIASNATNSGVEEIASVKKTRNVMEVKVLKTFDFMDNKIDYIHESIDKLEGNKSNNIQYNNIEQ